MAALKNPRNMTVVAMLGVAVLAIGFWMLLLSPKRDEAKKLDAQVAEVESSLAGHEAEVAAAEAARDQFPTDYQKLVVLGKAVPAGDETASLLVQMNGIAKRAGVELNDISTSSEGGGEEAPAAAPAGGEAVSPTEAAASLLPLGATVGPAGLAVMPYSLSFEGTFFQIADFIRGLDSMVKTHNEEVTVNGRLLTIDSFTLGSGEGEAGSGSTLSADFSVTTYLTPPGEGLTAGASPESPAGLSATPAATTTGGAP
jgi:Tfp pilus assembly protein PilO